MKQKILTTGLSGLVGSRISELLCRYFEFENLSRKEGFDITNIDSLERVIAKSEADTFIHLAAFTDVDTAWRQKGDKNGVCYRVNVIGTKNVATLCSKYNKFLIHFSTDFVFSGEKEGVYTEEDNPDPIEWYGQTKVWAEEEVMSAGCKYCILRIASPFRAYFPPKMDKVRKIIEGIKNSTLPPMFVDQVITPTFIDDIASGVRMISTKKPQGVFHLVGSTSLSPYLLACKICDVFGFNSNLIKRGSLARYLAENPTARPFQKNLSLSNEKIKKIGVKMNEIDRALTILKDQIDKLLAIS